ncbi:MAG: helix-turn-helix domain-containing protein [Oscillospiraceae bacterium]|nr:helix-turn-helix domain-containing protein [Oscillospiraceae bacterium]
MLSITRYSVKNECLTAWIKFIWHFEAGDANIHYKLLPTDCIDIILNQSGNIFYEVGSHRISAAPFHINGLRSRHSYIRQTGNIRIFGISFYPFGLYPFINKPLASIHDKVVNLHELSWTLAQNLECAISKGTTNKSIIENIENALCLELRVTEECINKARLIHDYLDSDKDTTIQSFCAKHSIHPKTFTRNVLQYTGYTPKILRSIKIFQKAGNEVVKKEQLSDIAYDNDFADQAHFTREFRKFSGMPPRAFQQEGTTLKENAQYTYR